METAILCGGSGKRMGGVNKGRLKLCGEDFVEILHRRFSRVGRVFVVGREEEFPEYESYSDAISGVGPLGGILKALEVASSEKVLVVPCDTPLFSVESAEYLLKLSDEFEIVAFHLEKITPIPGVYSRSLASDLERFLRSGGRSITSFLLTRRSLLVYPRSWKSLKGVNTPRDYEELLKTVECGGEKNV